MTSDDIRELFQYNTWANDRMFDAAAQVPIEEYMRDLKSSHGGIHGTLTHIIGAEKIWLSRWVGVPDKMVLQGKEVASLRDLKTIWDKVRLEREVFLNALTDAKLQEPFSMTTTNGDTYTHTFAQMMQHMVTHSAYHRGQVTAMIRQLGHTPVNTDLITYYRRK